MMTNNFDKFIKPGVIDLIVIGDEDALEDMFNHYDKFIKNLCTKYLYNNGVVYKHFDEDKEQSLKILLVNAIKKFKY